MKNLKSLTKRESKKAKGGVMMLLLAFGIAEIVIFSYGIYAIW